MILLIHHLLTIIEASLLVVWPELLTLICILLTHLVWRVLIRVLAIIGARAHRMAMLHLDGHMIIVLLHLHVLLLHVLVSRPTHCVSALVPHLLCMLIIPVRLHHVGRRIRLLRLPSTIVRALIALHHVVMLVLHSCLLLLAPGVLLCRVLLLM